MFGLEHCLSFAMVYRGVCFRFWSESQRVATCSRTFVCLRDAFVILVQLGSVASGLCLLREDALSGHVTWRRVVVASAKINRWSCGRVVEKPVALLCVQVWALHKQQLTVFRIEQSSDFQV